MGRRSLVLCVAALLALPMATALAGGSKSPLQAPPGMLKAEAKLAAEMQQVTEDYLDQLAVLEQAIGEVEPYAELGVPGAQEELAALTAQADALTDEFWQTIDKLNDEIYDIHVKIEEWQRKHGITAPPPM